MTFNKGVILKDAELIAEFFNAIITRRGRLSDDYAADCLLEWRDASRAAQGPDRPILAGSRGLRGLYARDRSRNLCLPNDQAADPTTVTVRKLGESEGFTIPPGQLAFLLTEEVVSVPVNALAFISIRAKTKFRGLVNVSGFHVDPGYRGQLTFAVFNAGPVPVHLKRGQAIFLIWYANLDCETTFKKDGVLRTGIDPELINAVSGELQSFASLSKKIKDIDRTLGDRVHAVEKEQTYCRIVGAIVLTLVLGLTVNWLKDRFTSRPAPPVPALSAPQAPR